MTIENAQTDEELAREAIAPLLNPEPHPFQEQWSDAHSMNTDTLLARLTKAITTARALGRAEAITNHDATERNEK